MVEKNGRYAVEKLGMKGITRDGMDYEFTLVFDLNIKHLATASKDRTGLFMDKPEEVITPEHGKKILEWCNSGISIPEIKSQISTTQSVEQLRDILKAYPEYRKELDPLAISRKEELSAKNINQI